VFEITEISHTPQCKTVFLGKILRGPFFHHQNIFKMTFKKISICTFVFLIFATIGFSQKNNIIYTQFTGKNGSFSMNYDRKIGTYHDATGQCDFYGHIGIGKLSSHEIIATKVIKGTNSPNSPNVQFTNDLLGLLFNILFNAANTKTPDVTLQQQQSFDVTNYCLGGKILLGKGVFNVIVGIDARYDRVEQRIEAWETKPAQTINYGKTFISPSIGLRLISNHLTAQLVLSPQTIYGKHGRTEGVINVGFGFQF
jgi:hypothetical protein